MASENVPGAMKPRMPTVACPVGIAAIGAGRGAMPAWTGMRTAPGTSMRLPRKIEPTATRMYIAPPTTPGAQGQYVYLYGPGLWSLDAGISKKFGLGGSRSFNFEALMINALNHRNTTVAGTNGATVSIDSTTFGQSTGVAIAARQIQFRLGYNW